MKISGIKMYLYGILEKLVPRTKRNETRRCADRGGRCAVVVRDAMRGPLRTGSICAMRCAVVVRDAMRGRCTGCDARSLYCAMRCEVVVRDAMRGLVAFARCATRCALVAFARCRRHHAFDGGILRVVFLGLVKRPYVRQSSPGRKLAFARLCEQQKG